MRLKEQSRTGTSFAALAFMSQTKNPTEPEPHGPEGVPVDAPDNMAPAISPQAVSRMHRAEDDEVARRNSPEFSDAQNIAIDDRVAGERWIPGVTGADDGEVPKRRK